jgi:hypothetical protein
MQGVSPEESGAIFLPQSGGNPDPAGMAYAIYSFDLSTLDNPHAPFGIEVRELGPPSDERTVFAAISDPEQGRWQWVQLQQWPGEPDNMCFWGLKVPGEPSPPGEPVGAMRHTPFQNIVILVTGSAEFHVESVAIRASDSPPAGGTLAFKTSWDLATAKCPCAVELERDAGGTLNATYYNDSNGQMYHMWQDGRIWLSQALSCAGDNGSSHDLVVSPDGGLWNAFYETDSSTAAIMKMDSIDLQQKQWLPANFRFESGIDDGGFTIAAGGKPSVTFDDEGVPHIFYECATTGRIRHAWQPLGMLEWLHEYISPEGELEGQPIGMNSPQGLVCLTRKGWDGCIYRPSTGTWFATPIVGDMHNPLDPVSDQAFFDAVCRDSTVIIAMACTGGQRLVRYELLTDEVVQDEIYNDSPGGGCYIDLSVMEDGSVRIAQYNAVDKTIYFETGDIPGEEQFSSLPAVQYGEDEDCDGLAFEVFRESPSKPHLSAMLVELSSSPSHLVSGGMKKEFKGHVTLLK